MGCVDSKTMTSTTEIPRRREEKYISDQMRVQQEDEMNNLKEQLQEMKAAMAKQNKEINSLKIQVQTSNNKSSSLLKQQYEGLQNLGEKTMRQYTLLCRECLPKLEKFSAIRSGIVICKRCDGHGAVMSAKQLEGKCQVCKYERFFTKVNLCEVCHGRGATLD